MSGLMSLNIRLVCLVGAMDWDRACGLDLMRSTGLDQAALLHFRSIE